VAERPYPDLQRDLMRLAPTGFLLTTPYLQLNHLARYLQAALRRAERYGHSPGKDEQMAAQVGLYQQRLDAFCGEPLSPFCARAGAIQSLRWMVEEYRVSVFAQELGTAHPVSPKRLDKQLSAIEALA
jgi:ATP-dependent helicase HrpA